MERLDAHHDKLLNEHLLDFDKEHEKTLERERIDEENQALIESIDVPCQHCFSVGTAEWDVIDSGDVAVVCLNCGSSSGYCSDRKMAVDLWCGHERHKFNGSTKVVAVRQIVDNIESECCSSLCLDGASMEAMYRAINMIWNNEIKGIRFECGGADNRGKR